MSSTSRGAARSPADFYATPNWCTLAFFRWMAGCKDMRPSLVVDPCAGEGHVLQVAATVGLRVGGLELREECRPALDDIVPGGALYGDALEGPVSRGLRAKLETVPGAAVVTNPPYSLAQEFVTTWAPCVAWSAWLLRLNFIGSQKRAAWFRGDGRPSHVLVLPKRPSFTGGGTDSCEYAWFVWPGRGARAMTTTLDVLEV